MNEVGVNPVSVNQVGRYQILNELGRGATGVVYKALDPTIGRTIAIKTIPLSGVGEGEDKKLIRERLLREAQSAGALSHPSIVTVYDILESDDFVHILMEYIEGDSLQELQRAGTLPSHRELWQFLKQIADGLDYAHRKGIVHRDIKPANILISKPQQDSGRVAKIADFGIASFVSRDPIRGGAKTETATNGAPVAMTGTPNYMSPEQIQGLDISGLSDQFALGAIVYELLTGERPFSAEGLPSLFYQICKQTPKAVESINPALNDTVGKVMSRVLAKEPSQRFATCSDFIGALSIGLSESPEWGRAPSKPAVESVAPKAETADSIPVILNVDLPPHIQAKAKQESAPPEKAETAVPPPRDVPLNAPSSRTLSYPVNSPLNPQRIQPVVPPVESASTAGPTLSGWERVAQRAAASEARESNAPGGKFWLILALCVAVGIAALFIIRWNTAPMVPVQVLDTKAGSASPPPADADKIAQSAHTPADLNPPPTPPSVNNDAAKDTAKKESEPAAAPQPSEATPTPVVPKPAPVPERVAKARPPDAETLPDRTISDVELVSDPPGAKITIDGNATLACNAPCSLNLPGGRHTLIAELSGYATMRKIFNAPAQDNVFVSLTQNMGVLFLSSIPPGSSVSVDGRAEGRTPLTLKLPAGSHRITLFNGDQRRHDETVEIDADGMLTRSFRW